MREITNLLLAFMLMNLAVFTTQASVAAATAQRDTIDLTVDNDDDAERMVDVIQQVMNSESDSLTVVKGNRVVNINISDLGETTIADMMGPFLICIAVFAFMLGMLWMILYFATRRSRSRDKLIELSLQTGNPLPPNFMPSSSATRQMRKGIIWIGVALFWLLAIHSGARWLSLVFLAIGISNIAMYAISSNRTGIPPCPPEPPVYNPPTFRDNNPDTNC